MREIAKMEAEAARAARSWAGHLRDCRRCQGATRGGTVPLSRLCAGGLAAYEYREKANWRLAALVRAIRDSMEAGPRRG